MLYVLHERKTIFNVPEELWQRLRVLAAERNTTISKLAVEAMKIYFAGGEKMTMNRRSLFNIKGRLQ